METVAHSRRRELIKGMETVTQGKKNENRNRQKNPSESVFYNAFESAIKSMHDTTRERL